MAANDLAFYEENVFVFRFNTGSNPIFNQLGRVAFIGVSIGGIVFGNGKHWFFNMMY